MSDNEEVLLEGRILLALRFVWVQCADTCGCSSCQRESREQKYECLQVDRSKSASGESASAVDVEASSRVGLGF